MVRQATAGQRRALWQPPVNLVAAPTSPRLIDTDALRDSMDIAETVFATLTALDTEDV